MSSHSPSSHPATPERGPGAPRVGRAEPELLPDRTAPADRQLPLPPVSSGRQSPASPIPTPACPCPRTSCCTTSAPTASISPPTSICPPATTNPKGPLPTLMEAYPAEFKSRAAASQVTGSPYEFVRIGAVRQSSSPQPATRCWPTPPSPSSARGKPSPTTPTPSNLSPAPRQPSMQAQQPARSIPSASA
jgi:hypothetical protein